MGTGNRGSEGRGSGSSTRKGVEGRGGEVIGAEL